MAISFAALVLRPAEISDRALSRGFAVALAGWDVPAPELMIVPLAGVPGHVVAFYASGAKVRRGAEDEAFDLACELFEDELPPALAVLDAALEEGREGARVYAITYAEGIFHDDAWRFDERGFERRFVHEGEDAVEAGVETAEGVEERAIDVDGDARALDQAARAHRGSTFLSRELGAPVLAALVGALFEDPRRLPIRLVEPTAEAITEETAHLCRVLHRVRGRGAFTATDVAGVPAPALARAFVAAYDWADPEDPEDAYRELALGGVEGTLRFLRAADLAALDADPTWKQAARGELFPIARLGGSALGGGGGGKATLALVGESDRLVLVRAGQAPKEAGPTLGELIRYLALGWSKRTESEEDMIGALMLRARIRGGL